MFRMATFLSGLFLMQIAPTAQSVKTTLQSRPIRIPRVLYEPCRNQEAGKFIRDRYDCHKFFYCAPDELAISVDCPHGMIFNDEKEICDFPSNYYCIADRMEEDVVDHAAGQAHGTSIAPPTKPANKDKRCPTDDTSALVFLSNTDECHRYYICYHGNPLAQECIRELHWNAKIERCDFPENAGCLVTTSTPTSTSVAANNYVGAAISCPFRGEQVFPHPEKCNFFIYCVNGYASVQQCPFFHHYDVLSKSCMWQTMAKCLVRKEIPKPIIRQ